VAVIDISLKTGNGIDLIKRIKARNPYRTVGRGGERAERSPVESLSGRELKVFQLVGQGLDTQQIALKMLVSPKTVETYRARIKEKLHLTSSTELIRWAVQWAAGSG
jgi:DNA-binding NarL/FixJ family response regulator